MKSLKMRFPIIIAALTIIVTIVVQTGTFASQKFARIANCFVPSPSITYDHNCIARPDGVLTTSTTCQGAMGALGAHAFSGLSDTNKILDADVPTECAGTDLLCCVYVEPDPAPCTFQPTFVLNGLPADEYRIVGIECKSDL